jgi:UDP-N-acetylmuramate--alanine ligase
LPATVAVVTNVELDHHATFGSDAELEEAFETWTSGIETVVWGKDLESVDFKLAVPGWHNQLNAACALAALEAVDVPRPDAERVLADFTGAHRRFELAAEVNGVRLYDDYGHHPAEIAATLETARGLANGGRVLALFQPHLYSRTLHLADELAAALARADIVCVTEIYPAREEPVPGVSGKLVVDRLSEARPGMRVGWAPALSDAAAVLASFARPGDLVLTIGAGDVDSALRSIEERLR